MRIVIVFLLCSFSLVAYAQSGQMDTVFSSSANNTIYTTQMTSNNHFLIAGRFNLYNNNSANFLTTIDSVGNSNIAINGGSAFNGDVLCSAKDAQGNIYLGGVFTTYNGQDAKYIIKIDSLGNRLPFNTYFNNSISCILIQSDGKILVGGNFTRFDIYTCNRIARLSPEGYLDMNFWLNNGTGFNGSVNCMALHLDGKIIIGGYFTSFNARVRKYAAAILNDGRIDVGFCAGSDQGFNFAVKTIAVQKNEQIILGGLFTTCKNQAAKRIVRLNENGDIDTSFKSDIGFNNTVEKIHLDNNENILVTGSFTRFNNVSKNRIIRLNTKGTIDEQFKTGTGLNATGKDFLFSNDGHLYIVGEFTMYNSNNANYMVKILYNDIQIVDVPNYAICPNSVIEVSIKTTGAFKQNNNFITQLSDSNGSFSNAISLSGNVSNEKIKSFIPDTISKGNNYKIRIISTFPYIVGSGSSIVSISPNALPTPNTNSVNICDSAQVTLNSGVSNISTSWYDAHQQLISTNNNITTNIIKDTTHFHLSLENSGCVSKVYTINIIVNESPKINLDSKYNELVVSSNKPVCSYQWITKKLDSIPNANQPQFNPSDDQEYAVQVTHKGCTTTSPFARIASTTNITDEYNSMFEIYPNPSQGEVNISTHQNSNIDKIIILNTQGVIITEFNTMNSLNKLNFDQKGTYFIQFINQGNIETVERLVVL